MLHHLSLGVLDLTRSGLFYDAVMQALGFRRVYDGDTSIGYGLEDDADILLLNLSPDASPPGDGLHVAFAAASRSAVDAFHRAGLATGGMDNGPAGLRPDYGDTYYAAFLIDPDGHRIEAVTRSPM